MDRWMHDFYLLQKQEQSVTSLMNCFSKIICSPFTLLIFFFQFLAKAFFSTCFVFKKEVITYIDWDSRYKFEFEMIISDRIIGTLQILYSRGDRQKKKWLHTALTIGMLILKYLGTGKKNVSTWTTNGINKTIKNTGLKLIYL